MVVWFMCDGSGVLEELGVVCEGEERWRVEVERKGGVGVGMGGRGGGISPLSPPAV